MAKRKNSAAQPELKIELPVNTDGVQTTKPLDEADGAKPNGNGNGNDSTHVLAEAVALPPPRPFEPRKIELPIHSRVNKSFMEYASYVIRDRAIPHLADGLKPVQRRILWALHEKDDGRFIKVANVTGHCMQYHPHGNASIDDALVVLTNKRYLIEGQGNFGNIFTGDPAAAPRYIECRLTQLARKEVFNDEITEFVPSYDGRNKEPVALPCKLPLLLMLGTEGIAVGMACRILPHNFPELLEAQIAILKKQPFKMLPDFVTGGLMDARGYKDGTGEIKVRAKIKVKDESTVGHQGNPADDHDRFVDVSIEDASRKGKIKVKSVNDFTSEEVEIEVKAPSGVSAEQLMDALYAFTDCEITICQPHHRHQRKSAGRDDRVARCCEENTKQLAGDAEARAGAEAAETRERTALPARSCAFSSRNASTKKSSSARTNEAVNEAVVTKVSSRSSARLYRELSQDDVEMLLGVAHPPHFALRHQQAPRGDGQGQGRPGRNAEAPEERHQIRHRAAGSVAREVRPDLSAPDQVEPLRRSRGQRSRVQGVQGRLRPRVRLRRLQSFRRRIQDASARSSTSSSWCSGWPLQGHRAAGEIVRRAGLGILRPAGARPGHSPASTPTARRRI